MLDWLSCNAQGHGPLEPPPPMVDPVISHPPSLLFSSMQGKCDREKSVVVIFRINTLTPSLTVGSDVNQVYRPMREMGEERKEFLGVGLQECRLCGSS